MKKLFFMCAALLLTFCCVAQTQSGNMMVGGNFNFTSQKYQSSNSSSTSIVLSPAFGYFVQENLAVGATLSLTSSNTESGASQSSSSSFAFGPFARYYMFTANESFAFFGQAQFTIGTGRSEDTFGGENKESRTTLSLAPGFAYFFNEHWALDFSVTGILFQSYDPDTSVGNNKQTTFVFNVSSLSPSLGFRYHFGN